MRRDPWLRGGMLVLAVLYWVALAIATHIPQDAVPTSRYSDKVLHFLAYGGLATMLAGLLLLRRPLRRWDYLALLGVIGVYGALDELLQIPVGRSCELLDWAADMTGASFALGLVWLILRIMPERPVEAESREVAEASAAEV